jgi:hypothetical protein
MYDAEDVFKLLKSYGQELTLDDMLKFGSKTLLKRLRKRLGLTAAGIKVFEDTDWNEQREVNRETRVHPRGRGGGRRAAAPHQNRNLKNRFCRHDNIKSLT